jgi:tetratricopeptide (TPR) repeat protein
METGPLFFGAALTSRSRSSLLFLLGCLLLFASPLSAQTSLGRIIGQLHVSKGDFPAHPILVELQLRGSTLNSVYSDDQGRFGFYNLEANPYHVVINDPGFRAVDELSNVNPLITTFNLLQINLDPRDDGKVAPAANQVKGSNPYLVDTTDYSRRFPKNAVKEFDRGVKADAEGRHDDAVEHYQKALKIAPDFYMAHNNLGSDYLSKSDFPGARQEFQRASQLNQSDAAAYFNLSNVCILTGELPQAQLYLDQGMQRQPDSAFGHFLQGTLDIRLGKLALAEDSLRHAIQLDPMMAQARLQLVNLLLQQGHKEDAVIQLRDFLAAFPASPFAGKAKDLLKRLEAPGPASQAVSK